jgi:hypothetical protein
VTGVTAHVSAAARGFVALGALAASNGCGRGDVTFKVGGTDDAEVRYQLGGEDVVLGRTELPWSSTTRIGFETSLRVNAFSRGSDAWCEIWIRDQLCDREDDGAWCSCYWDDGVWSGTVNDDEAQRTRVY